MKVRTNSLALTAVLIATLSSVVGCEAAKELPKVIKGPPGATANQPGTAVPAVAATGPTAAVNAEFVVGDSPAKSSSCFTRLVLLPGRGNVLQITSYAPETFDGKTEVFPSFVARAKVDVGTANELIGKSLKADVYLRATKDAPVLCTTREQPMDIVVKSIEGNVLVADVNGFLSSSLPGQVVPLKGSLRGTLQ